MWVVSGRRPVNRDVRLGPQRACCTKACFSSKLCFDRPSKFGVCIDGCICEGASGPLKTPSSGRMSSETKNRTFIGEFVDTATCTSWARIKQMPAYAVMSIGRWSQTSEQKKFSS